MFKVTTKKCVKGVTKVDWRERAIEKPRTKRIKGTSPMQTAYQLYCIAAVHPILLLHPISHWSSVHLPVKTSKPQVGLAHKQDNRSVIHWSRTTCLRHLKVQGPAKGKCGLDASHCLECLTEPHCSRVHTTGEAQPGQLEKEEGGAAIPSTVSVCTGANQALHSAPGDLWLAVFIVCTVGRCAHRYCLIFLQA